MKYLLYFYGKRKQFSCINMNIVLFAKKCKRGSQLDDINDKFFFLACTIRTRVEHYFRPRNGNIGRCY